MPWYNSNMENEKIYPIAITEQEQIPPFDAILVHSFWISRMGKASTESDKFKVSFRSHFVAHAANCLYNEEKKIGKTAKIIVVGGRVRGPSYPSTASVIKDELINNYHVPEEDILMGEQDEYNTEEEVETLSKLAQENGWSNVASISFQTHKKSVIDALSKVPSNIHTGFISVEDIINKYDRPQVKTLMKRLNSSKYQWGYEVYEATKTVFRKFPGVYKRMLDKNEQLRKTKDNSNESLIHTFDKFKS